MLKFNQHIITSILISGMLTACGGGSSGSSNNGNGSIGTASSLVTLTSSLAHPTQTVVAGHDFTITAKSSHGGTILFSNALHTPGTISYDPASCNLSSSNNLCTTKVKVGLGAIHAGLNSEYATNVKYISSTGSSVEHLSFNVTEPIIEVTTQPNPQIILAGNTTTIGFSIPDGSVPSGSGSLALNLKANTNAGIVTFDQQCTITYVNGIVPEGGNHCSSITVTGANAGSTTIVASAANFENATTKPITVQQRVGTPAVGISTSGLSNANIVVGKTFTITATSQNGADTTVNFANGESISGGITYNPSTCLVNQSSTCTTVVTVGVDTPANHNYVTDISYSGSSSVPATSLSFSVESGLLQVSKQPTPATINTEDTTTSETGFTIDSTTIPSGNGVLNLLLSSSDATVATVPPSCSISYNNGVVTGGSCSSVIVTSQNKAGSAQITAARPNYTSVTTNPVTVIVPTPEPSIIIIPSFNGNTGSAGSVFAGQSFQLNIKSANVAASIGFTNASGTPSGVTYSISSCNITTTEDCTVSVKVALDTPATTGNKEYAANIIDTAPGANNQILGSFSFRVIKPQLELLSEPDSTYLLKGATAFFGFTIPEVQIPEGSGSVSVDLSSIPQGSLHLVSANPCTITYSGGAIINGGAAGSCSSIVTSINQTGFPKLKATTANFVDAASDTIFVPRNMAYVFGNASVSMLGDPGTGELSFIKAPPLTLPVNPGVVVMKTINNTNYIYVTDTSANSVKQYSIIASNGVPTATPSASVATQSNPIAMLFASQYAYVLNKGSNSLSIYKVNQTNGSLSLVENYGVLSNPVGITATADGKYLYVISQNKTKNGSLVGYSIGSNGKLSQIYINGISSPNPAKVMTLDYIPTTVAIAPSSMKYNDIMIVTEEMPGANGTHSFWANVNNADGSINISYVADNPGVVLVGGTYFNPVLPFYVDMRQDGVSAYQFYGSAYPSWYQRTGTSFSSSELGVNTVAYSNDGIMLYLGYQNSAQISTYKEDVNNGNLMPSNLPVINTKVTPPLKSIIVGPNY